MQLPAEFQKQSQMPSQMAASANSSNLKKEKIQVVVAEGYPGATVMLPQSLTGPLSRAAPEKYADSSAHIAHHHLCGTSESRVCIVSV